MLAPGAAVFGVRLNIYTVPSAPCLLVAPTDGVGEYVVAPAGRHKRPHEVVEACVQPPDRALGDGE